MKILHMCLKAPIDFLAWRMMDIGDICYYCNEEIKHIDNGNMETE